MAAPMGAPPMATPRPLRWWLWLRLRLRDHHGRRWSATPMVTDVATPVPAPVATGLSPARIAMMGARPIAVRSAIPGIYRAVGRRRVIAAAAAVPVSRLVDVRIANTAAKTQHGQNDQRPKARDGKHRTVPFLLGPSEI